MVNRGTRYGRTEWRVGKRRRTRRKSQKRRLQKKKKFHKSSRWKKSHSKYKKSQRDSVMFLSALGHNLRISIIQICNITLCRSADAAETLSTVIPIPKSQLAPYRAIIIMRLVILSLFIHYRVTNPVDSAYPLWLTSVICEIWFAFSWVLDQFPKWAPINRETYVDRLSAWYAPNLKFQVLLPLF